MIPENRIFFMLKIPLIGKGFLALSILAAFWLLEGPNLGYGEVIFSDKEKKLSLSLPEVVIESPDIERLVAQRVRPTPPRQLGVVIPKIFPRAKMPEFSLPRRPQPRERKPDPELAKVMGGLSRLFGSSEKIYESGLAYMKKDAPVEALSYFEEAYKSADSPRLKAAAQYWAAETLERLGRKKESLQRRRSLSKATPRFAEPYRSAALYALAENRCEERDYEGCLGWLDKGKWRLGKFASGEARLLRAWVQIQLKAWLRAIDIFRLLVSEEPEKALNPLVSMGHLYFSKGEFAKAERAYLRAEAIRTPRGRKDAELLGEALGGVGWARLLLGRIEEASRAFSLFIKRHPNHPLMPLVETGLLAVRIETDWKNAGRLVDRFVEKYPANEQIGPLRLQLAWALFRARDYRRAQKLAASVSDIYPLGRIYRLGRIIEGLSLYHLGEVGKAYGVLRTGAERPPAGGRERIAEQSAARSAAMATAFAAFRLKDYQGAQAVLERWAFPPGTNKNSKASDNEAALWYGEAALEANDLDRARRAFEKISEDANEWYPARAALAWIHYRKKEWRQAALMFDRVFSMKPLGPLAAEALARGGEARFNLGDYAGTLRAFERIEKEYAGGRVAHEALLEKGKLLFRRSRLEEASKVFGVYLERYPKSAAATEVEFWVALIWYRQGRYKIARESLLAFSKRHPKSPLAAAAYLRVGDSFYNQGLYSQADQAYRLLMGRYPGSPQVREAAYGLILTCLQQNDTNRFISEARKFIDSYGEDELAIALGFQVGEIRLTQGDLTGALRAYRELEARYKSSELAAHALLRIASIHRRRNELDAALDAYESLMNRFPDNPLSSDALLGIGESLAGVGRCAEAREKLGVFLERYPRHDYRQIALYEQGRCMAKLGDLTESVTHLKKVIVGGYDGSSLQINASLLLAALLSKQGKLGEAAEALNLALLSHDPKVAAEALYRRADILSRQNDRQAASEFLKLTYQFAGQTMWVTRALARAGELYEKTGKCTIALRIFQKMRNVAPKGPMRKKAEEAIVRLSRQSSPRQ